MVELYKITRVLAPQVVGDKREDANNQNLNAEFSPLIKENSSEGQSFRIEGYALNKRGGQSAQVKGAKR
jgi:cell division protein FtsL